LLQAPGQSKGGSDNAFPVERSTKKGTDNGLSQPEKNPLPVDPLQSVQKITSPLQRFDAGGTPEKTHRMIRDNYYRSIGYLSNTSSAS
jgi:hypothetical protein